MNDPHNKRQFLKNAAMLGGAASLLTSNQAQAYSSETEATVLVFETVEKMILGIAADGQAINFSNIFNSGTDYIIAKTIWNNSSSKVGGAEYIIRSSMGVSTTVDGYDPNDSSPSYIGGDHYVGGGTNYVATYKPINAIVEMSAFGVIYDWDKDSETGTDNTNAGQLAIDYAFNRGYHQVSLGAGSLFFTTWKLPSANNYSTAGLKVFGNGIRATGLYSNTTKPIHIQPSDENDTAAYNIELDGFSLRAVDSISGQLGNGIFVKKLAYSSFNNINVSGFKNCFRLYDDCWLNSFTKLYMSGVHEYGFKMDAHGTSNFWDRCYDYGATVRGYKLTGSYSTIGSLAADHITGDYAYEFSYFSGSINSLGNESSQVIRTMIVNKSDISLRYGLAIYNTISSAEGKGGFLSGKESTIKIDCLEIVGGLDEGVAPTSDKAPNDTFECNLEIGHITYKNCEFTGEPGGASSQKTSLIISNGGTPIAVSADGTGRPYLGFDRGRMNDSSADPRIKGTFAIPKAIFLDMAANPRFDSDGHDYIDGSPARVGDVFLESKPHINNQFARVITETGVKLSDCMSKRIPLELAGNTSDRPITGLRAGLNYFDTTLNKPIWYNGSNWVDANGANV